MTENKRPIMIGKDKPKSDKKNNDIKHHKRSDASENTKKTESSSTGLIPSESSVKPAHEKTGRVKELSLPILSFSFIFIVIILNLLFFISIFAGISYYSISNRVQKMHEVYFQRGKELNLILSSIATESLKRNNYHDLNIIFSKLANRQDAIKRENPVYEAVLINEKGVVIAHSDMSKITVGERDISKRVSNFYNNDFFHEPLLFEAGNVLTKDYKFFQDGIRDRYSHFIEFILSEKFSYSTDFSSAIEYKKRNAATLHIIMNKMYIYNFIKNWAFDSLWVLGIVAGGSIVFSAFILMIFYFRGKSIKKICSSYLALQSSAEPINIDLEKSLTKLVDRIEEKSRIQPQEKADIEKPEEHHKKDDEKILDAILIDED